MLRREFLSGCGAAGVLSLGGCSAFSEELALPEPAQVDRDPWPIAEGMVGLSAFSARVLVLSRRDYPVNAADTLSAVSPTDLAVAWGPAAEAAARRAAEVTQSDRRLYWRARTSDMSIPGVGRFTRYSGNWHMIAAADDVARGLRRVAKGDIVRIEGDLVQVTFTNGLYFRSSLSREDVGDGACEIVRARSIEIERRVD